MIEIESALLSNSKHEDKEDFSFVEVEAKEHTDIPNKTEHPTLQDPVKNHSHDNAPKEEKKDANETQPPPLTRQRSSYRVRQRRSENDSFLGYAFYKMLFLVAQLTVMIRTWNVTACHDLQVMNLVIFFLLFLPFQLFWGRFKLTVILWCVAWPTVLFFGQVQLARSNIECNELLYSWSLVLLIMFFYIPTIILFIALASILIDLITEAFQIPRAIAALQTYLASNKKRPDNECCICSTEYQNDDALTQLNCKHEFHTECIVPWLKKHPHNSCPLCRSSLLPDSLIDVEVVTVDSINPE